MGTGGAANGAETRGDEGASSSDPRGVDVVARGLVLVSDGNVKVYEGQLVTFQRTSGGAYRVVRTDATSGLDGSKSKARSCLWRWRWRRRWRRRLGWRSCEGRLTRQTYLSHHAQT